jgi:hypothetical protein
LRAFEPQIPARDFDNRLYECLKNINGYLQQVDTAFGLIGRGLVPVAGAGPGIPGTTIGGLIRHSQLLGLEADDHLQYLLLAGRSAGQIAHGTKGSGSSGATTDVSEFSTQKEGTGGVTWTPIAIGTSAQINDIIVVVVCTAGRDGSPTQTHDALTDTKGHTWTRHAFASFERPAAPNRFAAASIWTTVITTPLVSGVDTLGLTFSGAVGSRAIESRIFRGFSGAIVSLAGSTFQGVDVNSPADPPASLTISGLTSREYLFIRATSIADNNTSYTASSGYTEFTSVHTNATTSHGTLDDNVGCRGEFSIVTSTGSTSAGPTINLTNLPMTLSLLVALKVTGGNAGSLKFFSGDDSSSAEIAMVGSTITSNFDFFNFRAIGGVTTLSYIRGSDGAFVGPVVAVGTDTHPDNIFRIVGSSDATKKVAFEVDGLTTATTRLLTVPDVDGILILSQGTSAGQVIGTGAHTGGAASSMVIENSIMIGDGLSGTNFTAGRVLNALHGAGNNTSFFLLRNTLNTPSGAASGAFFFLDIQPQAVGYSSGSYTYTGFRFLAASTIVASGVTCSNATGAIIQCSPVGANDVGSGNPHGPISIYRGLLITTIGTTIPSDREIAVSVTAGSTAVTSAGLFVSPIASGHSIRSSGGVGVIAPVTTITITDASNGVLSQNATVTGATTGVIGPLSTEITGLRIAMSARTQTVTDLRAISIVDNGGGNQWVKNASVIELISAPGSTVNTETWSFIKNTVTVSGPGTIWLFNFTSTNSSRHAGMFSIGHTATPTSWIHLGTGTTTISPLRFVAGTNLTTPLSGTEEYDGSYFYLTHGDAIRTLIPTQRGTLNLTAQAAAIGATALYAPPAAGYYLVHYTLEDTTADVTAGTIQFQINYTDDIGATNQVGAALILTATGRDRGTFQIYSASGTITYQTNLVGIIATSRYALRVRLEAMG